MKNLFFKRLNITVILIILLSGVLFAQENGGPAGSTILGNPYNTNQSFNPNNGNNHGPENYSGPGTPQEIKDALENGTLGNPSEESGNSEHSSEGESSSENGGTTDTSQTEEKISESELRAQAAENAAAEAVKKYVEESAILNNLESQLVAADNKIQQDLNQNKDSSTDFFYNGLDKLVQDLNNKKTLEQQVAEQKQKVQDSKYAVEENAAQMKDAYGELAEVYNEAGDPVKLSTGEFIAEYDDFNAIDYISSFKIVRKLGHNGVTESFGTNWICPLDARIAVCESFDFSQYIYVLDSISKQIVKEKDILNQVYIEYPEYKSAVLDNYLKNLEQKKIKYDYMTQYYDSFTPQYAMGKYSNVHVKYGAFSNFSSVYGNSDMIIFLDEEGRKRTYVFTTNGYWECLDSYAKDKIKIYGKNYNGSVNRTGKHDGGYILYYEDGTTSEYSDLGLKLRTTDRNENVTKYIYNGSRVSSILLPTGEVIEITRNQRDLITSITGTYSGRASYTYSGNRLVSVTDNNGIKLSYNYDEDGDLSKIIKGDGTAVQLSYGRDNTYRKVCFSIIDENGCREVFQYNPYNNQVSHMTVSGQREEFVYNSWGNTIRKTDTGGRITEITCDTRGRVSTVKYMGNTKTYSYDSKNKIAAVSESKGGTDYYTYNSYGDLATHKDKDGYIRTFNYDASGNVKSIYYGGNPVQSFLYYPTGLVKEMTRDNLVYSYTYNQFGQLTKKIIRSNGKQILQELWNYDNRGRISEYTNSNNAKITYSYAENYVKENHNGRKTIERYYDLRKRGYRIVYKDLINKTQYTKQYSLDGVGNIKAVYLGDVLYAQYDYTPDRKIKQQIIWNNIGSDTVYSTYKQGIKTEFIFNPYNFIERTNKSVMKASENQSKLQIIADDSGESQNYNYNWSEDGLCISSVNKYGNTEKYFYDYKGRLIKIIKTDGYTKSFSYSQAGRLLTVQDTNGESFTYNYRADGSYTINRRNKSGNTAVYEYDKYENIKKYTDYKGYVTDFNYDSLGNLTGKHNNRQTVQWNYDNRNRLIKKETKDNHNVVIETVEWAYDDEHHSVHETINKNNKIQHFYDELDREIKTIDKYGNTYIYYDQLGNVVRKVFPDGTETVYEYTPDGFLSYSKKSNGEELIQKYDLNNNCTEQLLNGQVIFTGSYGSGNHLVKSTNSLGAVSKFNYNYDTLLQTQFNYDTGSLSYQIGGKDFSLTNENNYKITKTVGPKGKITFIKDNYGNEERFSYDEFGKQIFHQGIGGDSKTISYDYDDNQIQVMYSNGQAVHIGKNNWNQITGIKNSDYELEYEYTIDGLLKKEKNKGLSLTVEYAYDSLDRCISKKSRDFDFSYSYDNRGNVKEIKEKTSNCTVGFTYDNRNREIGRIYSNGNTVETGYDGNLKSYIVVKNKNNQIIQGDFVLYDSNHRVSLLCNEKGEIRRFFYDSKGRLESVEYAFTEQIQRHSYKEALECGMFIKDKNLELPGKTLSISEKNELTKLIEKTSAKNKVYLPDSQKIWKEEYTYNSTGSIIKVKNPYGIISYEYDYLNRITRKYSTGQNQAGIYYKWDKSGNLIEIKTMNRLLSFSYNEQNLLKTFSEESLLSGDYNFVEYLYDGLGRRRSEIINGKQQFEYVYDGVTRSVLCKFPVTVNKVSLEKYSAYSGKTDKERDSQISSENYKLQSYKDNGEADYRTISITQAEAFDSYKQSQLPYDDVKMNSDSVDEVEEWTGDLLANRREARLTLFINAYEAPCVLIYKDSGINGYETNYLIQDYFGNVPKICDDYNVISYTEYDIWGNSFVDSRANFYAGKNDLLISDFPVYDFGSRLYLPQIKSFTTMDKRKMDGNWYAYCPADPVNYKDESGFFKRSTKKSQDTEYVSKLSDFMLFDGEEQAENGIEMGIPLSYDCADTTAAIDQQCAEAAGMSDYSPMADDFEQNYKSNDYDKARQDTSSADYWNGDGSKTTKVSNDIKDLTNPEFTTPGTIIVTAPDPDKGIFTGHTILVIARDYDENGNIKGVVYLEGHMGDNKPAETGYMYVDDECNSYLDTYNIKSWKGTYSGSYELESSNVDTWTGNPEFKCGK